MLSTQPALRQPLSGLALAAGNRDTLLGMATRGLALLLLLTACLSAAPKHRSAEWIVEADRRFHLFTAADNEAAIDLYARAARTFPSAESHAGLAEALAQRFFWDRSDRDSLEASLTASSEAIRRDGNSARGHFARAFAFGLAGRPKDAASEYLRTFALDPDYPRAAKFGLGQLWRAGVYDQAYHWSARQLEKEPRSLEVLFHNAVVSGFLLDIGRGEAMMRRALEIDPHFGIAHGELAFFAQARGDTEEAVRQMEAGVAANPKDPLNVLGLAQMLIPAGQAQRAREVIEKVLAGDRAARAYGGRSGLTIYGWALWELGERDAAIRIFDEMLANLAARESGGETSYQLYREMAAIHAVRGNRLEGLRAARLAVEKGWHLYGSRTMPDPMFRSLAGDPDFEVLLDQMRAEVMAMRRKAGLPPLDQGLTVKGHFFETWMVFPSIR